MSERQTHHVVTTAFHSHLIYYACCAKPCIANEQLNLVSHASCGVLTYIHHVEEVIAFLLYYLGDEMKKFLCVSVLAASVVLPLAGCSMWPGNPSNDNPSNSMTMEQCRQHMAMSGNANTRKDDMTPKRDAECARMMRR